MRARLSLSLSLSLAVALALSCVPVAQAAAPTPIPLPEKPSFAAFPLSAGSWACSQKSSRRPSAVKFPIAVAPSPDGYWLVVTLHFPATPWYPHPTTEIDHYTYDAQAGSWVDISHDDNGGYGATTSTGPDGAHWVWHNVKIAPDPEGTEGDFILTKVSATRVAYHNIYTLKSGKIVTLDGSCTKSS